MSGEGAHTSAKRLKTDTCGSFFKEFLKKEIEKDLLEEAYISLCGGSSDLVFRTLEILQTNALLSEEFTRASCEVQMYEKYRTDEKPLARIYAAGSIFRNGIFILKKLLDPHPQVPEDGKQMEALKKLLNYLIADKDCKHDHDIALVESETCDEAEWAVIVAQHLLSPLTVDGSYTIDDSYDNLRFQPSCPCKNGESVDVDFDDNSFGWIDGWYGRSDILINNVSVHLAGAEDDNLKVGSSAVSLAESSTDTKTSNHQEQVLAQTIVFSFLKRKEYGDDLKHCLVPTIGISKKKIVIYFYDSEEDVLLGTTELDLFGYKSICYDTIVFLWLTLNYDIFCTGITDSMKNCKAKFFTKVGSFLENYRNDVTRNLPKGEYLSQDETGWTKSGAVEEKIPINSDKENFGIRMNRL
ncbi:uncharacterized protein LOC127715972 [Mytilus californianus]|uniref:uncharacterized protein LOC127715972 n=1 Tax=Mytilus californianus TaxID=6549 RepID=UPI0022457D11|nr:uncharacterized protein LOC127715972 [Mytilus californianus]